MEESKREKLAAALQQAGKAHHQAFSATGGADLEWPMWYAAYLLEEVRQLHSPDLSQSELVYWLIAADRAYRLEQPPSCCWAFQAWLQASSTARQDHLSTLGSQFEVQMNAVGI